MQETQSSLIISLFNALGSSNDTERVEAENRLQLYKNANGFLLVLLEVIQRPDVNFGTKLQGAIYFKNCITKRWCLACDEYDPDNSNIVISTPINNEEKATIRTSLLSLLVSSPDSISKQLIESLIQIGLEEYYVTWPSMMNDLIALCNQNDVSVFYRVLSVIEGICRVIETVPDNDIIGHVVIHFIDDLDTFLKTVWDILVSLLPSVSNDYDRLELVLSCLVYIANTRKYWISVDVSKNMNYQDEIENYSYIGLDFWMSHFITMLDYKNPLMDESSTATVVEDLKSSIISFCSICVTHNGELFAPFFDAFTKAIWNLLNSVNKIETLKYQDMIVSSLKFFSSLCSKREYRDMFNNEEMMKQLLEFVIIPNCMATIEVSDQFESEPALFIKNYEEGYKTSSQRYAVSHLIASLRNQFQDKFTQFLMAAISSLLNTSLESRDCAYHLFFYRCAEFPCIMRPIRSFPDEESVKQFVANVVIPDLSSVSPLLIADALIAIGVFLNVFSDDMLFTVINQCVQLGGHQVETVRILAMIILERILTKIQLSKTTTIRPETIASQIIPLTNYLLSVSLPIKQTDHYLIKTFLRIVLFLNEHIMSYSKEMLEKLASILSIISQNLSNPHYIHYLFESLVAFVRISSSNQQLCSDIETYLLPSMQEYLNRGIVEFMPYIFQLYGLILYSRSSISQFFIDLLPIICSEGVWKERSNQTALVFLLKVYLLKNPQLFASEQSVRDLFQIFRTLCMKRPSRVDSLDLLFHILLLLPLSSYQPFLPTVIDILVMITSKGASRAVKEKVLLILAILQILHGSGSFIPLITAKSQTTFVSFFNGLFMNAIEETQTLLRKIEVVGISQLLVNEPAFYQGVWTTLGYGVVMLVKANAKDVSTPQLVLDGSNLLGATVEYDAYHKLSLAKIQITDPLPQISDIDSVAKEAIQGIASKLGNSLDPIMAALPEAERSYLEKRLSLSVC